MLNKALIMASLLVLANTCHADNSMSFKQISEYAMGKCKEAYNTGKLVMQRKDIGFWPQGSGEMIELHEKIGSSDLILKLQADPINGFNGNCYVNRLENKIYRIYQENTVIVLNPDSGITPPPINKRE